MECKLCQIQYVEKSKTPFSLRLNMRRKDINNPKAIPAYHHLKTHGQNFMKREVHFNSTINRNIKCK